MPTGALEECLVMRVPLVDARTRQGSGRGAKKAAQGYQRCPEAPGVLSAAWLQGKGVPCQPFQSAMEPGASGRAAF